MSSAQECVEKLQEDLNKLYSWQERNNIKFNGSKFELIRYGRKQDLKDNTMYFSTQPELVIEEAEHLRDLGEILSSDILRKLLLLSTRKWDTETSCGLLQPAVSTWSISSISKTGKLSTSVYRQISEVKQMNYWDGFRALNLNHKNEDSRDIGYLKSYRGTSAKLWGTMVHQ